MQKSIWTFLLLFVLIIGCSSKGKYNGTLIFNWNNSESRQDDKLVIENRLKKIGIKNYTIDVIDGKTIKVEVKNVKDTVRFIYLMNYNEGLEFWETYDNPSIYSKMDELDRRLGAGTDHIIFETDSSLNWGQRDSAQQANTLLQHPLWSRLQLAVQTDERGRQYLRPGPEVGFAQISDTAAINSILQTGYKTSFPGDLVLRWKLMQKEDSICTLIALRESSGTRWAFMNQSSIEESEMDETNQGMDCLTIKFDKKGSKLWEKMTRKNIGKQIAITIGEQVISYPTVESTISGGVAMITGPDVEELKIIQQGSTLIPFNTKPAIITHHFEKN